MQIEMQKCLVIEVPASGARGEERIRWVKEALEIKTVLLQRQERVQPA